MRSNGISQRAFLISTALVLTVLYIPIFIINAQQGSATNSGSTSVLITSLTPNIGLPSSFVTINGSNFDTVDGNEIFFDSTPITSLTSADGTYLTFPVPANSLQCTATTSSISSANNTALVPNVGPAGTSVIIRGKGFATTSTNTIQFGPVTIQNLASINKGTTLTFMVPNSVDASGTPLQNSDVYKVSVINDSGKVIDYAGVFTIATSTPASGTVVATTTCQYSNAPGPHQIYVVNKYGTSSIATFTTLDENASSTTGTGPSIQTLTPADGGYGTQMELDGEGFTTDGTTAVIFNGQPVAASTTSSSIITFSIPDTQTLVDAQAYSVYVQVTDSNGDIVNSNSIQFVFDASQNANATGATSSASNSNDSTAASHNGVPLVITSNVPAPTEPIITEGVHYVNNGDGTITDTTNGLMWQACVIGQSGSDCSEGSPTRLAYGDATTSCVSSNFDGYSGWRVPFIEELQPLMEKMYANSTFASNNFPNDPQDFLWTRSIYGERIKTEPVASRPRYVVYYTGEPDESFTFTNFYARCVRSTTGTDPAAAEDANQPSVVATTTPTTPSTPTCGILPVNTSLTTGQSVNSCNGTYQLTFQNDGNVVLYSNATGTQKPLWSTRTNGRKRSPAVMNMQSDGNLVIYDSTTAVAPSDAIWSSGNTSTVGTNGLSVQDDGNLVIYDTSGAVIWSSHSQQTNSYSSSVSGGGRDARSSGGGGGGSTVIGQPKLSN